MNAALSDVHGIYEYIVSLKKLNSLLINISSIVTKKSHPLDTIPGSDAITGGDFVRGEFVLPGFRVRFELYLCYIADKK